MRKKITFAAEPGDRVPAWLLCPDDPPAATRRPAILCLHQTIAIGKDEPVGLGTNPDLQYAHELADRGYVTLSPDYPNFGEYHLNVYNLGYQSATMKAIWNNLRAVDLLCSLKEVDPERIGAIGHSLGGHNAIFTALFDSRIKAVVSSCGFNAFPCYYNGNIAGWSHQGYMPRLRTVHGLDLKKVPFDFPELIAALAPRRFLHELAPSRRQFRGRRCESLLRRGPARLRALWSIRPPECRLSRRPACLPQRGSIARLRIPGPDPETVSLLKLAKRLAHLPPRVSSVPANP